MVSYFYKSNRKVRLTPEKRNTISSEINNLFKSYYTDLEVPKDETAALLNELYPSLKTNSDKINKIPSIYEQYKTYMSALHRACYPSLEAIVDIRGLDLRSNDLAGTYKASLIYDWYNIDLISTLDKVLDDWVKKGEAALYVCWKEETVQIEQDVPVVEYDVENMIPKLSTETVKRDLQTFKAVDVKRIDPFNLYFDKSQVDNWEHCRKIYRDFVPVETVLANEGYNLTKEERKDIRELVYKSNKQNKNQYETKIDENTKVYGSTVEVLEFEGDFIDPDTCEVLYNMEATVVAGKYLARFEKSSKPQTSIIWGAYLKRPDTGRGQSPLTIPSILNAVQNMCADIMMTSWKLNTYPTFLAPKGALPLYTDVQAGRVVEYEPDMMSGATPTKLDFTSGLRGFEFSDFFQRKMENSTGINQYMQGANDGSVRTASEASYIHSGATMRMAEESHLFTHNIIYKLVRKYALFKKVYDTGNIEIPVGPNQYAKVTDEVRNGNYYFIIGGSQSAVERDGETQKLFNLLGSPVFQSLSAVLDPVTAAEFMKWILNRMNFQDTDQVMELMTLNGQLYKIAAQLGISNSSFAGFRNDMLARFPEQVPNIVNQMLAEKRANEIQQ